MIYIIRDARGDIRDANGVLPEQVTSQRVTISWLPLSGTLGAL